MDICLHDEGISRSLCVLRFGLSFFYIQHSTTAKGKIVTHDEIGTWKTLTQQCIPIDRLNAAFVPCILLLVDVCPFHSSGLRFRDLILMLITFAFFSLFLSPIQSTAHSTLKIHFDKGEKPKTKQCANNNNDANRVNQIKRESEGESERMRANCAENFSSNTYLFKCAHTHTHYLSPTITGNIIFAWLNGLFHAHWTFNKRNPN